MMRKDGLEIRTEQDTNWQPTATIEHPMAPTHKDTEQCVDIPAPNKTGSVEWQNSLNAHRPYYDKENDEYWPRMQLYDKDGNILPENEQVSGAAVSGAEAKLKGWLQ